MPPRKVADFPRGFSCSVPHRGVVKRSDSHAREHTPSTHAEHIRKRRSRATVLAILTPGDAPPETPPPERAPAPPGCNLLRGRYLVFPLTRLSYSGRSVTRVGC